VYETTSGGLPVETLAGHKGDILEAAISPGYQYVATASTDGTARLWQGPRSTPSQQRIDPGGDAHVPGLGLTPDGTRIIVPGQGHQASGAGRILDARDLHTLATFSAPPGHVFVGIVVSRDGRRVIAGSGTVSSNGAVTGVNAVESFSTRTGARVATMAPSGGRTIFDAQPDYLGDRLVALEPGGIAEMWDTRTGKLLRTFTGTNTVAAAAAFSWDGKLLAIAHYPLLSSHVTIRTTYQQIFVQLYDLASGHLLRTISGPKLTNQTPGEASAAPLTVAFSPDGRYLAFSGADPTVSIVDPATGRPAHPPLTTAGLAAGSYVNMLAFSPDGRYLVASSSSGVYLWPVPGFTPPPVILQHVAAGATTGVVGVSQAVRFGFTRDSRNLVTVGGGQLDAWNVASQLQLQKISGVGTGSFNLSGTTLVTASGDGITVYPCSLCGGLTQLLALAKQRVTRDFTAPERTQYLKRG
jgi:WD40 repeat protein